MAASGVGGVERPDDRDGAEGLARDRAAAQAAAAAAAAAKPKDPLAPQAIRIPTGPGKSKTLEPLLRQRQGEDLRRGRLPLRSKSADVTVRVNHDGGYRVFGGASGTF